MAQIIQNTIVLALGFTPLNISCVPKKGVVKFRVDTYALFSHLVNKKQVKLLC